MGLENQKTTSDFIEWDAACSLITKLERDQNYSFAMLFAIGIFCGIRISDILNLTWQQILHPDYIELIEKKTNKYRKIRINDQLKEISSRIYNKVNAPVNTFIFINKKGSKLSTQYINRQLKMIKYHYNVKVDNISSHSLRKSFGRRVWEIHNHSEKALIFLSEMFNHSSVSITKRYLGIRESELQRVYELL